MLITIFEKNLMWSTRLQRSIKSLGHEAEIIDKPSAQYKPGDAAIINLASEDFDLEVLVNQLKSEGIYVIAHAGHKEEECLDAGKKLNCDYIVTNRYLAEKIDKVIDSIPTHSSKILNNE